VSLSALADAFEHHVWATQRLIDACLELEPEQLEKAVPGTYGSILDTMRHLVDGDSTYLVWLTGDRAHAVESDGMDLRELRDAIEHNPSVGVRLAQALHHGTDHRSQICTALTTVDVKPPSIDVWSFGLVTGRIVEVLRQ
jgi:uncharacterized damage-inducible protein DinB